MQRCEKCGKKLEGVFGSSRPESGLLAMLCKTSLGVPESICRDCLRLFAEPIKEKLLARLAGIKSHLDGFLSAIELSTCLPRAGVEYQHCGVVTARAAVGSDFFIELADSALKPASSGPGLWKAELSCLEELRFKAFELEADVVAGLRFSYTELSAAGGMLLVCAAGTAMRLKDGPERAERVALRDEYRALNELGRLLEGLGGL